MCMSDQQADQAQNCAGARDKNQTHLLEDSLGGNAELHRMT